MQYVTQIVLEDIGIKMDAKLSYQKAPGATWGMGCHSQWIAEFYLLADFTTATTLTGGVVPGLKKSDRYNGGFYHDAKKIAEIHDDIQKYRHPESERENIFQGIVDMFSVANDPNYPTSHSLIIMSDIVNYRTPSNVASSGINKSMAISGVKIVDFVDWLKKTKKGIIMGSPIIRNQIYQTMGTFSQCQAWFWIPPVHAIHAVPDSHFILGTENMPDVATWERNTSERLGIPIKDLDKSLWRHPELESAYDSHREWGRLGQGDSRRER